MASSSSPEPPTVTLDTSREQFYLAQRASERFAQQLGGFVAYLQQQKDDDAWLEQVQEEASKIKMFHEEQYRQWEATSGNIDAYVESVKALAETMAVNELKGEDTAEAELPENKAKTVHPELVKFQLEKKARILGKIGGIPALGPGMGAVLPALPKGQILKATGSAAAREIHYSKMEHKDAAQLAGVFQFRKAAASDVTPVAWQEEEKAKNVRRASEAAAAELLRQQQQEEQLAGGGQAGAELAGALKLRQHRIKSIEEEDAAAHANMFQRTLHSASNSGAARATTPEQELQAATPELAQRLKQRQEAAEIARRHSEGEAAQQQDAPGTASSTSTDGTPGWCNANAPFGSELASLLQKRRSMKEAAEAAAPVRGSSSSSAPHISNTASSELQELLRQRQSKLEQQQQQQSLQQDSHQG